MESIADEIRIMLAFQSNTWMLLPFNYKQRLNCASVLYVFNWIFMLQFQDKFSLYTLFLFTYVLHVYILNYV